MTVDHAAVVRALIERLRGTANGTEVTMGWPTLMLDAADTLAALEAERDDALKQAAMFKAGAEIGGDVLYERWQAAERALQHATDALELVGWDIGEPELCWCPDSWFVVDDLGSPRHEDDEHSAACVKARDALAAARVQAEPAETK